ncbi:MAG: DNA/RNA nuclease SfsA [Candidatus Methanomethylicaceae archaeon]
MSVHVPLFKMEGPIYKGYFLGRPNRFTVILKHQGKEVPCHLHDPGRLRELLLKGACVLFRRVIGASRKTDYDVLAVDSSGVWVITDSRIPNRILKRLIELSIIDYKIIDQEVKCGSSRIDFLLEKHGERYLTEVKGCTLCKGGTALFPDAPTSRGRRQIESMLENPKVRPFLVFVVLRPDAHQLSPNVETDPDFYEAVKIGKRRGLYTASFKASLESDGFVHYRGEIPVVIE